MPADPRRKAAEFTDARFAAGFLEVLQPLLPLRLMSAAGTADGG